MRFSGPAKRRRENAGGRVPPVWAARPSAPMWPPRYGPLGSPFLVPFFPGGPPPPDVQLCAAGGVPGVFKKEKAKIVQFEWNGCTFYRYIPDKVNAAGGAGRLEPTPPPPPLPPFGRPPRSFEWHQRAQSRRRKQMFPPRTPAPAWVPGPNLPPERSNAGGSKQFGGATAAVGGNPSGGGQFRARDNPRIPRKESKTPASHMHLPPFLAATSSKSGTATKTPSPPTHQQGPPRGASFRNKDAASAPLPYSVRAAFGAEGASPPLPKKPEQHSAPSIPTSSANQQATGGGAKSKFGGGGRGEGGGAVTARRSQDSGIPESDILGAKPKKRMGNMTFNKSTAERPVSGPAGNNAKTYTRAPPFRNSPRVYSSTVLKDAGGKQECRGAAGEGSKPVPSTPKVSPPKEQRPSRHERRMRYKAEVVGSNVVVTQEENSPDKKGDGDKAAATAAPPKASTTAARPPGGGKKGHHEKSSAHKGQAAAPKTKTPQWSDFDVSVFRSQVATLAAGTGPTNTGRSSADASTQVAENFSFNEQIDRYLTPGPRSSMSAGSDYSAGGLTSPSGDEWPDGNSRSVSIQTHENEEPSRPQEKQGSKSGCQASVHAQVKETQSAYRKTDESKRDVIVCNGAAGPNFGKVEMNGVLDEALSDGEHISLASYLDEPPTSSSEIYLDSLVSNGTSTSSPREDTYRKSICGANRMPNQDGPAMVFEEMNVFLKECSPIKTAAKRAEAAAQAQALSDACGASSSGPSSNAPSRSPEGDSAHPETSSSALTSTSCSSLSKGDGFSDISEPQSPLAKDLKVPDNTSLASDVIVINFAEDTTTLREHLEGLAADYNAKQEETTGADGADAEESDPELLAINTSGHSNVLERHTGSSPTGSIAPVLQPTHVSPGEASKIAQETRSAGGDFCGGARGRGDSFNQEQPQDQRRQRGGALSERGDDPFTASHKGAVADTRGADCTGSYQRQDAFCSKCGDCCGSPGSGDSQGVVRVCSCKMRRGGLRSMAVAEGMEEALKEEYRDPQLVPYFVEETVEYLLLDSDSEEYEESKRRASVRFSESRGQAGFEERSAASERYPENGSSWNKLKEGSEASAVSPARCSSDATTAASRALMYDCPWWTYDQGSDGASDLKGSSNKALASCDRITTSSPAIPEMGPMAAGTLHPWSTPLGAAASCDGGAEAAGATAAVGNNPWGPFLATAEAMVGPRMEAASGDHESSEQVACRMVRSDADFSTLYMEGQPRKPSLKQRWASVDVAATAGVGETGSSGVTAALGTDRDSLSFYEFPMNEHPEAIPPQRHSLSMETLVGSNMIEAASTSSTGGGGEPPLTDVSVGAQSAEAIENKDSGTHSPNAQCCELELYGPGNKGDAAACTVAVPPQALAEDGAKGDASFDGEVMPGTPPDDLNSCGDKKTPEGPKPMGKIRTKFRDFFWKHK